MEAAAPAEARFSTAPAGEEATDELDVWMAAMDGWAAEDLSSDNERGSISSDAPTAEMHQYLEFLDGADDHLPGAKRRRRKIAWTARESALILGGVRANLLERLLEDLGQLGDGLRERVEPRLQMRDLVLLLGFEGREKPALVLDRVEPLL